MSTTVILNPQNGHVFFGKLEITPNTKLSDLNDNFSIGEEMLIHVAEKKVPCTFAKAALSSEDKEYEISLRFENEVLVSIFISIVDPTLTIKTQEDFYSSLNAIMNIHKSWLKNQIGETISEHSEFKWGVIGVAQDKSDNIYIYLHNHNNTWVFNT